MPARKKAAAPKAPKPVEAIVHADKRANIPTADAQEFVTPEVEEPITLRWDRDPSLDPQLVWKGKDDDADELEVTVPPIYIQEKIDPRVLIENLRTTAAAGESEPELTLFDSFDGLGDLDLVDFYQHESNWSNRMILGDSLAVMASLAEREALRGKVQMIYLDPPYGIKFGSNWQLSTRKRDVKDGKLEDATREVEQIKAFRDTWELGIHSYLGYLRDRMLVARDLLTESGSIFVQIGDENVHLVRCLMDEVFGSENFVSLISFATTSGFTQSAALGRSGDFVIWYARDTGQLKYRRTYRRRTLADDVGARYRRVEMTDGTRRPMLSTERVDPTTLPRGSQVYRHDNLTSQGSTPSGTVEFDFGGVRFHPGRGSHWKTNADGMQRLALAGRLGAPTQRSLAYVRFLDDFPLAEYNNVWPDTQTGAFTDEKVYVVQTNTRVIERCMLMCTDPGDLVVDPTCGSGTTAAVAEQWGRRWITVDTSRVALALARQRIMGAKFPYYLLADSAEGRAKEAAVTGSTLAASQPTDDIRHGFVYERVQHITLKSIANNPDVKEGMSREDIDAAIKRHADFELLYDRPYIDKKRVRVAGPFTVESLSPHRSLAFAGGPAQPASEQVAAADASAASFEQMILANLQKAGIQNGRRKERLEIETVEAYAGEYVQAVALRRGAGEDEADDVPDRIGISIGPEYGTVGQTFIKAAVKEAIKAGDIDLLCVLGFAFDPTALGAAGVAVTTDDDFASVAGERKLGRVPVLLVRMNSDLVMGDDLKKTGAGNLFTVFGEPDIEIAPQSDGQLVVTLHGVDVFDPTTGEVRSRDTDHIALWMIDTSYNEESFFVRHCYFTGGQDPYKRLKSDLKAEVDEEVWATLYRTESTPFDRPATGKIAVKVINDYGDEVLQVFEV